jgi:SprT protein
MDNLSLHDKAICRVREMLIISGRLWPEKCGSLKMPLIRYTLKGKTAGKAWLLKWEISLNPHMAALNGDRFVMETVTHEMAHLIAHKLNLKDRPHGGTWESVMVAFGQTPKRLHNFKVSGINSMRKPQSRFIYTCKCREHHITKTRHNRILRGVEYRCLYCKGVLTPFNKS